LDLAAGGDKRAFARDSGRNVVDLAFSPDGKTLAGAGWNVGFWDSATGSQLATVPITPMSFAFSPDGTKLALGFVKSEHEPSCVSVWDWRQQVELVRFVCHYRPFRLAWSPGGHTIATASVDMTVKLWDIDRILNDQGN
jgi:WD40 repeat protein